MVFPDRSTRVIPAGRQGEVALTLAVLSVLMMVVGTIAGIGVNRTQDIRSSAAGTGQYCGLPCDTNANCGIDRASGSKTQCDFSKKPRICVSVNTRDNPRCPTGLKTCGESCSADYNCNAPLTCDRNKKICSGSMCPAVEPTASGGTGGGTGGGGTGGGTGGSLPTPVPTGAVGSGIGTAFRVTSLACKVEFGFQWDPQLVSLKISDPNNPRNVLVVNNSMITRVDPPHCISDKAPIGKVIGFTSGHTAGIFVTVDPRTSKEILITLNGGGGADCSFVYYYMPFPSWLNGSVDYKVDIEYEGKLANVTHRWSQTGSTKACTTVTPTVTPTATPTPRIRDACDSLCTDRGFDCDAYAPDGSGKKLTCYQVAPFVNRCRNKDYPTYSDCLPHATTPTMTVTPTRTPTPTITTSPSPTRTPTPTATPTPAVCNKSVYFIIDNSSTQADNPGKISAALNTYFSKHTYDNVSFSYDTFNRIVEPGNAVGGQRGVSKNGITFSIPEKRWTNINAAFEAINNAKINGITPDMKVFISDGIPTVLDTGQTQCTYSHLKGPNYDNNASSIWTGCGPNADGSSQYATTTACETRFPGTKNICSRVYPIGSAQATYAVTMEKKVQGGGEGSMQDNMLRSGGSVYANLDAFVADLPAKLNELCNRTPGNGLFGRDRPRSFMSSFTVQNQSNKSVQSVNVKTCNQAGGNCLTFLNTVGVAPQSTGRFSQVIPDSVPADNRAVVTCDVNYADGSSLPCPKKQTQNESVQFNLTVNNKTVAGSTKTFLQAADVNNDGRVNGIDYVLCQKQIAASGAKSCDIVSDDLVNARDISVVAERLGQATK